MKKAGPKPSCATDWESVGEILECRLGDKKAKEWAGLMSRIGQIMCWDSTKSHSDEFTSFLETSEEIDNKEILKELREMRRESSEAKNKLAGRVHELEEKLQKAKQGSRKHHITNLMQAGDATQACPAGSGHCPVAAFGFAGTLCTDDCKISSGFCSPFALSTHWGFYAEL